MWVYRNAVYKSGFLHDDENYERSNISKRLYADEFLVLDILHYIIWKCEKDIISNLRCSSNFFSYISDKRILEILKSLSEREYIEREYVKTDLKEEHPNGLNCSDTPNACISVRTDQ